MTTMFEQFPNRWTPVLPLNELTSNPLATELAGERIVLFQDNEQQWHALIDRCPHRGAALSLGQVTEEGHLRCRYHGWRYDGTGQCMAVPLNNLKDTALAKIRATVVPTKIIGGALWVYTTTEPLTDMPPDPILPDSLDGDPDMFIAHHQEWQAHWTRAQENFLDFAHPPYTHEQTIGTYLYDFAETGGTVRVETEPTEFGMTMKSFRDASDSYFRLDWYRPNLSILNFGTSTKNWMHVFCIPINEKNTRVMTVRRSSTSRHVEGFERHTTDTDHPILDEDRIVVESQSGDILSNPQEISVASDGPALAFRRWYEALLDS
jgi:phenylpropionate dioxygenase-like ring-hydroxylating dioxygenase large terminal subunit